MGSRALSRKSASAIFGRPAVRYIAVAPEAVIPDSAGTACGRSERSQPAESQECGMENYDHPQSRHTRMSGDGVMGG